MKTDRFFMAVRKTDGVEWFDINAWGYVVTTVDSKTQETDKNIPHWAKDNPVVRVVQVEIRELEDVTHYERFTTVRGNSA